MKLITLWIGVLCATHLCIARADDTSLSEGILLAGEIILTPSGKTVNNSAEASHNINKARSHLDEGDRPWVAPSELEPWEENGLFSRPGWGILPDNRTKAQNYLDKTHSDDIKSTLPRVPGQVIPRSDSPRKNVERNLNRAHHYLNGTSASGHKVRTTVKWGTTVPVEHTSGVAVLNGQVYVDGKQVPNGQTIYTSPTTQKTYLIHWGKHDNISVQEQ
jgi:hypothetical protein